MTPTTDPSLFGLLRSAAARYGARPALAQRGLLRYARWSYADLLERAEQAVAALAAHGVRPGDRVLTCAPNSPALVAAYFGVWRAGAILVPLDPRTPPAVAARVAARVAPRLLITDGRRHGLDAPGLALPTLRSLALADLWAAPASPGQEQVADDADGAAAVAALPPGVTLREVAEIVFTSGTTGEPRGVVLTHANVLASVRAGRRVLPLRPGDAVLSLLPLSHMLEQTAGLLVPLARGAQIVYPASRQPQAVLRALRDNRVAAVVAVPQVLDLLRRAVEREVDGSSALAWRVARRLSSVLPWPARRVLFGPLHAALGGRLETFLCGGAPLPPALQDYWERLGVRVVQGYGATECAPGVTSNSLGRRIPGSVGQPLLGVAVRLAPDGEILVRGPNVTPGYWDDPAATAAALAGGWYHSGDLGVLDGAGNLYVRGRSRDLVVLADGQNVYPEDVEAALRADPAVRDCVVLGTPGADGAPCVHAVVLPAEGADAAAVRQAVQRAAQGLAPHQRPGRLSLWPAADFPRTPTLKVQRHLVAARVAGLAPPDPPLSPPGPTGDAALLGLLARLSGRAPETILPTSDLGLDLGLDSLARVELAALLADELGVELDDAAAAAATTVADLAALVAEAARTASERRAAGGPPAFPRWARRAPACWGRAALQRALLFPLVDRVCAPLNVTGQEHLRGLAGPVLLVANHGSHLDTPLLLRAVPAARRRRLMVAAAADYFYRRCELGALVSLLLGAFPLVRQGPARASLEYCGELVDDGWSVLVYPEGTRSASGRMAPFKPGIGLLAVELGVPVVPVRLVGTAARLPKGGRWPRRGPVAVRFGRPLRFAPDTPYAEAAARLEAAVRALGEDSALQPRASDLLAAAGAGLGGQLQAVHPLDAGEAHPARDHQPPGCAVLQR